MNLNQPLVNERFEAIAKLYPLKTALIFKEQHISYKDLSDRIDFIYNKLKNRGVQCGNVVVFHGERSPDYLITILAILKLKSIFLPLDSKLPEKRKEWILQDSQASFLIDHSKEDFTITKLLPREKFSDTIPEEAMYIMYTSGSSGTPKGVIGNHGGLLNRVDWMQRTFPIDEAEMHIMKTSIGFVDHIAEAFQSLLNAATLVILEEKLVSDVQSLVKTLVKYRVNRLVLVPSLLKAILELPEKRLLDLDHLKFIFSSGELLPIHLAKSCIEKLPKTRLINIYGSTEVSADATFYEVNFHTQKKIEELFNRKSSKHFSEPNVTLNEILSRFSSYDVPYYGKPIASYLTCLKDNVIPYCTDVSHPSFIGHMTSGIPSVMGELSSMITTHNQNTVKIETSKALTFLEREVIAKMHKLFYAFSTSFYEIYAQHAKACLGLILPGGTLANIQALHSAKYHALLAAGSSIEKIQAAGFHRELKRLGYQGAVIIGSRLMHYSIQKAGALLGIGKEDIHLIKYDDRYKLDLFDLKQKIQECQQQQLLIIAIVGVAGTTEVGSIDPLEEMGMIAQKEKIFFHVDAAWGGPLIFSARYKHLLCGIQCADSITICGHKQMYLPLGTSLLLFKDQTLANLGAVNADYQSQAGSHDQGQFSIMGSKPAQAVYIDAGLSIFGTTGYQYLIDKGCSLAENFAIMLKSNKAFQIVSMPEINIVTYRYIPEAIRNKSTYSKEDNDLITHYTSTIQNTQFIKGDSAVSYTTILKNNQRIGVFRVVLANPVTTIRNLHSVLQDQLNIAEVIMKESKQHLFKIDENAISSNSTIIPIGFPIDGCDILLLDEFNQEVPMGEIGEICIGGSVLASGYLNNQAETEKRFISLPLNSNKKMFKTGDFGRKINSGAIEYHGRYDQQVKVRGNRLDLLEIETQMHALLNVSQSCAIVYDGELFVFYSLKDESISLAPKEIKENLKLVLPEYAVPSKYILLNSFPLLPNGKTDRQALISSLIDYTKKQEKTECIKDKTTFNIVSAICKDLLNLRYIDSTLNFFDLGFNSLSLNTFLVKLQENGYEKLKLKDLYSHPTVKELSLFLQSNQKDIELFTKMYRRADIIAQRQAALNNKKSS